MRKRGASWAVKRAAAQRPGGPEGPACLTPAWEVGVGEGTDAPSFPHSAVCKDLHSATCLDGRSRKVQSRRIHKCE